MRVLLLTPFPEKLVPAVLRAGDEWASSVVPLTDVNADWIVSFGYRYIIREPHLSRFKGRMINIHISMLPWNRGADPNFWSWFDATPKGVSIHCVDHGIDTGALLTQVEVIFPAGETLRTSYDRLMERAVQLFETSWSSIRSGAIKPMAMSGKGSYHRSRDKEPWWLMLPQGFDTPVAHVEEMGREHAAANRFWATYDYEIEKMRGYVSEASMYDADLPARP
jgi:methionyl-tRNA formyltransferase